MPLIVLSVGLMCIAYGYWTGVSQYDCSPNQAGAPGLRCNISGEWEVTVGNQTTGLKGAYSNGLE